MAGVNGPRDPTGHLTPLKREAPHKDPPPLRDSLSWD